jgi:hypothetical protein
MKPSFKLATVVFVACIYDQVAIAQTDTPGAQNNGNPISQYDVLGVKLGVSEKQARMALSGYRPSNDPKAGDYAGKPLKLDISDFYLNNPNDGKKIRAGFQIYYKGVGVDGQFDFVKVFLHEDKVWAIWRWDAAGRYEYGEARRNLLAKYPGATPMMTNVARVAGGSFVGSEGQDIGGVEAYDGTCANSPFNHAVTGDSINLARNCNRYFKVAYRIYSNNGVRQLSFGESALVDLNAGRAFFAGMRNVARQDALEEKKTLRQSNF